MKKKQGKPLWEVLQEAEKWQRKDKNAPLTFEEFHRLNVYRSNEDVKHSNDWSEMEWGCALSGEVGELCNYLKKRRRGDKIAKKALAHEVCDIITYLSLLCHKLDIELEPAIVEKFNEVSKRWKSKVRL
jgi:NTP pyrophosphatase (non-canonical NTP hydrolase)